MTNKETVEMVDRMRIVSVKMGALGFDLSKLRKDKGEELRNAARMLSDWADDLMQELGDD